MATWIARVPGRSAGLDAARVRSTGPTVRQSGGMALLIVGGLLVGITLATWLATRIARLVALLRRRRRRT